MNRLTFLAAASAILWASAACTSPSTAEGPPLPDGTFPAAGGSGACDADGDGVDGPRCFGLDCDDRDPGIHPGADEACGDGVDGDCDGITDEGCGCTPGDHSPCWEGEDRSRNVGACRDGVRHCGEDGTWGPCTGAVLPEDEAVDCDGVDSDCDGTEDPDACTGCPPGATEVCGNGLDDDCDGAIDPGGLCVLGCGDVNPRDEDPGELACCLRQPPATHEFQCHEGGGLAACEDRECLDLDGTLDTRCSKLCDQSGCVCGRRLPSGELVPVADCGFLSPCARMDCDDRQNQPCYSGPPRTLGVGICHAGTFSCERDGEGRRAWSECEGEQTPGIEVCGNGLDDDCDGRIDENDGATGRRCPAGPACPEGASELCGNGLDDDCDGFADEACLAATRRQDCWTGSLVTRGVGACRDGVQQEQGGTWGPCTGEVLPAGESCGDGVDSDCDGLGAEGGPEDEACCVAGVEACNGLDDDCDGMADEGLLDRCGQCPGTGSCYGAAFDDAGDCSAPGRTCSGVEPSPLDGDLITLVPGNGASGVTHLYADRTINSPFAYEVIQVDPASGEINWSVSFGSSLLVNEVAAGLDGSAWVSHYYSVSHVSADGEKLCTTGSLGNDFVGSMVPGPDGDLWFMYGFFPDYRLYRLSATEVVPEQAPGVPWPDGMPRCAFVDINPDAAKTYLDIPDGGSLVFDPDGRLWILEQEPHVLEDGVLTRLGNTGSFYYSWPSVGPDGDLYVGWPLRRIDLAKFRAGEPGASRELGTYGYNVNAQRPLRDGTVAAMYYSFSNDETRIVHVDPETGDELGSFDVTHDATFVSTSVVEDGAGLIWTGLGTKLHRLDLATGHWDVFEGGGTDVELYRFSAAGGGAAPAKGTWTQVVDSEAWNTAWGELTWEATPGPGGRVAVSVRFADSLEALPASTIVCGPYGTPPADLSECSRGRRYARIEIELTGTGRPVAGNVRLTWDRPL